MKVLKRNILNKRKGLTLERKKERKKERKRLYENLGEESKTKENERISKRKRFFKKKKRDLKLAGKIILKEKVKKKRKE